MRFTRVYSNGRIDNTVAISVAHKNSGKSWRLTKLAQKRAEASRFNGWTCAQEYIYTKDNDLSDPLSRNDAKLLRQNAYKRGLADGWLVGGSHTAAVPHVRVTISPEPPSSFQGGVSVCFIAPLSRPQSPSQVAFACATSPGASVAYGASAREKQSPRSRFF